MKMKSLSRVRPFATLWTVAHQAPQSVGFSRQEYWSGLPFPSPGDLPNPGIEPRSPTLQADTLTSEPPGKPIYCIKIMWMWSLSLSFRISYLLYSWEMWDDTVSTWWMKWDEWHRYYDIAFGYSPFCLKKALYGFYLAYVNCQHHYSYAWRPLLSKIELERKWKC